MTGGPGFGIAKQVNLEEMKKQQSIEKVTAGTRIETLAKWAVQFG